VTMHRHVGEAQNDEIGKEIEKRLGQYPAVSVRSPTKTPRHSDRGRQRHSRPP
jgi:hypothetical protein